MNGSWLTASALALPFAVSQPCTRRAAWGAGARPAPISAHSASLKPQRYVEGFLQLGHVPLEIFEAPLAPLEIFQALQN